MPGLRSDVRERALHTAPTIMDNIHAMLVRQLPGHDVAVIGQRAILAYLHSTLHLRRPNGLPLRWRMVLRWRTDLGFPLLRGAWSAKRRYLAAPMSTAFAMTAWTLSRFSSMESRYTFSICIPPVNWRVGKAPRDRWLKTAPQEIRERYLARCARDAAMGPERAGNAP